MFRLSTKGHHATRIMVCLARGSREAPKRTQEIVKEEGGTEAFVGQILISLKSAGLVRSHRGSNGGWSLTRDPREITAFDVLTATEGSILVRPCLSAGCERASWCMSRSLWKKANEAVTDVFSAITIAEMVSQEDGLRFPGKLAFEI